MLIISDFGQANNKCYSKNASCSRTVKIYMNRFCYQLPLTIIPFLFPVDSIESFKHQTFQPIFVCSDQLSKINTTNHCSIGNVSDNLSKMFPEINLFFYKAEV